MNTAVRRSIPIKLPAILTLAAHVAFFHQPGTQPPARGGRLAWGESGGWDFTRWWHAKVRGRLRACIKVLRGRSRPAAAALAGGLEPEKRRATSRPFSNGGPWSGASRLSMRPRKYLLARGHHELFRVMRAAGDDVRLQMIERLPGSAISLGRWRGCQRMLCCWLRGTARSWSSLRTSLSI